MVLYIVILLIIAAVAIAVWEAEEIYRQKETERHDFHQRMRCKFLHCKKHYSQ